MYYVCILCHQHIPTFINSHKMKSSNPHALFHRKNYFQHAKVKTKLYTLTILSNFIREYLHMSSIHGFYHLSFKKRHFLEKLLWVCVVGSAIYGAAKITEITLNRYQQNPTVISMERDRFSWNTSFPAATICPTFKVDDEQLEKYVQQSSAKNKTYFKEFLISLASATYTNFEEVLPYEDLPSEQFMDLLLQLKFNFKPSVTNSAITGSQYLLTEVISEMGICYAFNSQLAIYNSPSYWKSDQWNLVPSNETFYVNPLDGEVFSNIINMSTGFEVFIHGPHEVADVASKKIVSLNGYFLQLYLTGMTIFSTESTKYLNINQRKCRFYYESNLRHSPVYSYVLCRMDCRISLSKKLCGCVPHFYRHLAGETVCDVKGLHCLSKFKDQLILLKDSCSCLANCDEVNYIVEDMDTREWFLGSNLQWGLKEYPKMRLKRDVIFGFSDFLVYIGGMVGLFLGCSVLSFIEMIYFFTLRLFWYIVNYKSNNR